MSDATDPSSEADAVTKFSGEVTVSSVIIDQLSSGLYESPAACLKELINNSYDADATTVYLTVRPDASLIVIDDNGTGISRAEFEKHFKRIARSYKREDSDHTESGRPKVGKIGIGFVAANEICQRLDIVSTKEGSRERLSVTLDFEQMRLDVDQRRRGPDDVSKADFYGDVTLDAEMDEHYTRIFLTEVKEESMRILDGSRTGRGDSTLYGATAEQVRESLRRHNLRSWSDFDLYTRSVLEISLNVPVRYHDEWAGEHTRNLEDFALAADRLDFNVFIDGTELRKPVVLANTGGRTLIHRFSIEGESVGAEGYIYAQDSKLAPLDLNGLLIRIRNAAVGSYDSTYLGYPGHKAPLFQDWVSMEVYADDRLEEALNIDRRTLRVTHPAYVELQDRLHGELDNFFSQVRKELYGSRSAERKETGARAQLTQIRELQRETSGVREGTKAGDVAKPLIEALPQVSQKTINALARTYKAADVIRMVRHAALEAGVPSSQVEVLLEKLTETLLR
jgi:hypothetical protein